jgi:hypothetical protein
VRKQRSGHKRCQLGNPRWQVSKPHRLVRPLTVKPALPIHRGREKGLHPRAEQHAASAVGVGHGASRTAVHLLLCVQEQLNVVQAWQNGMHVIRSAYFFQATPAPSSGGRVRRSVVKEIHHGRLRPTLWCQTRRRPRNIWLGTARSTFQGMFTRRSLVRMFCFGTGNLCVGSNEQSTRSRWAGWPALGFSQWHRFQLFTRLSQAAVFKLVAFAPISSSHRSQSPQSRCSNAYNTGRCHQPLAPPADHSYSHWMK